MIEEIKFSGDRGGKGVEKMYAYIQETKQKAARGEVKLHCVCLHQRNNNPSIRKTGRNLPNGVPVFICKRCGKEIDPSKLTLDELKEALRTVDRSIDIIKVLAKASNEKDRELLEKLAKLQFRLTDVPKQYEAATRKNSDQNQRQPRSNSSWGRGNTQTR